MRNVEEQLVAQGRGTDYHYYLNKEITEPADYVELLSCLKFGSEEDVIHIHINCPGGCLQTTIQIVNAINDTKATVIGVADGLVASGASLIFFSCPAIEIKKYSTFMLHDGAGGNAGKVNENLVAIKHVSTILKQMYNDIYYPVITKKEIAKILQGQDLYLTSDQVEERIQKILEDMKINQKEIELGSE